ncbi:uncharacterized protein LOC62_03G003970 [Vanrija pseudolonga]|uniref:Uncharacterized protein n=1 Tax=Vanrija pseudolonga TaxID=143232 RepID=A0AAF0Y9H2_9TREE|nr:hypothetical protein LOC62_03G003970 [Vanrija pseudolonga]
MSWNPRDRPRTAAPMGPRPAPYPSLYTIPEAGEEGDGVIKVGPHSEATSSSEAQNAGVSDNDTRPRPQAAVGPAAEAAAATPTQAEQAEVEMDSVPVATAAAAAPASTDIVQPYPWHNVQSSR